MRVPRSRKRPNHRNSSRSSPQSTVVSADLPKVDVPAEHDDTPLLRPVDEIVQPSPGGWVVTPRLRMEEGLDQPAQVVHNLPGEGVMTSANPERGDNLFGFGQECAQK